MDTERNQILHLKMKTVMTTRSNLILVTHQYNTTIHEMTIHKYQFSITNIIHSVYAIRYDQRVGFNLDTYFSLSKILNNNFNFV